MRECRSCVHPLSRYTFPALSEVMNGVFTRDMHTLLCFLSDFSLEVVGRYTYRFKISTKKTFLKSKDRNQIPLTMLPDVSGESILKSGVEDCRLMISQRRSFEHAYCLCSKATLYTHSRFLVEKKLLRPLSSMSKSIWI